MDFFKNIQKDIEQYGKNGDHSLEYVGINLNKGNSFEYKCYRFLKNFPSDLELPNNPFANHSMLKQLDFQKNYDENIYRISYKINPNCCQEKETDNLELQIKDIIQLAKFDLNIAHLIIDVNNFIKNILMTEVEPICVLGCKIDQKGVVRDIKVYYQLKIYKKENFVSAFADTEKYFRIIEFMGTIGKTNKEQVDRIKKFFKIASTNEYEPMMLGIDIGKKIYKIKYYFQINENLFEKNDYYKLKSLTNSVEIEEIIQKFMTLGLKMKGFTIPYYSHNTHSMINLYFCEQ